jgi:hypothetical protein
MWRACISICYLMFLLEPLSAQLYLQIEKAGNPRTLKIPMYEELTFQLADDDAGWYTRQILGMDANSQTIMVGNSWVNIKDITRIKLKKQRAIANILGGALQVGGISMFFSDVWFTIQGEPQYSEGGMQWGLINFAVGTGIRLLWAPIKIRFGKGTRLRVVDLTF